MHSFGMPSIRSAGASTLAAISTAPEARSMNTTVSIPTITGSICTAVFKPTAAPRRKVGNTSTPLHSAYRLIPAKSAGMSAFCKICNNLPPCIISLVWKFFENCLLIRQISCFSCVIILLVRRTYLSRYSPSGKKGRSSLLLSSTAATEAAEAPHTGSIISNGACAPQAARTAATVDGIS